MASEISARRAFERAWSVYLLINSSIDPNDARQSTLERYIYKRSEAGEQDLDMLTVEGLAFLKKLDGSGADSFR